jgi:hypothetical protein
MERVENGSQVDWMGCEDENWIQLALYRVL